MNTLRQGAVALLYGLTAMSFAAVAQQSNPSGGSLSNEAPSHDSAAISYSSRAGAKITSASFVTKATQAGMTEVELGRMALQKSTNPEVRKFAQRMVDDHSKAGAELAAIAQSSHLKVPSKLDAAHADIVQAMHDKSDADFTAAYVKDMVSDHDAALALFQQGSKLSDTGLAQFASRTLPTLEEHKRMADALRANTRVATSE